MFKKFLSISLILIFISACSFDNKSGIWKNTNEISKIDDDVFKDFKTLKIKNKIFEDSIQIPGNFKFNISKPVNNSNWSDIFYNKSNNLDHFTYENKNELLFKSKKISSNEINNSILFKNENIISSDLKGNIIIFSLAEKKVIYKFNFYKKKFKKLKKKLNMIVENNIIYVSDNIGYLYAYDFVKNKVLWAKNYEIPFRSNLKLGQNYLIVANLNNSLFFFNKLDGKLLKLIPTEETLAKNEFINSISLTNKSILFLNTFGSLYSIDKKSLNINWFININESQELSLRNIFSGNEIINYNDKIIVSSNQNIYVIDSNTGLILFSKNFSPIIKPFINNDYLFLITKNNLIISINLRNKKIIYSYDINQKIADFLNTKKKEVKFKSIFIANKKILIFLKNSFVLNFGVRGELKSINKLPTKIKTNPIFIDGSLLYLDQKNRVSIVN